MTTTTLTVGPSWAGALTTVSTLPCTSYMWGDDFSEPQECRIPFFSYANFIGTTSRKYFSPGICFSGWTVGCDFPGPRDTGIPESVTRKLCVPSGFECCGPSSAVTTVACNTTAVGKEVYTWQPAFEIRWEEKDISRMQTHPMTPGLKVVGGGSTSGANMGGVATLTASGSLSALTTTISLSGGSSGHVIPTSGLAPAGTGGTADVGSPKDVSAQATAEGETGLSTAAKIGIGVGIGVFVVLLAALLFFFIRRQRSQRLERNGAVAPQPNIHARRQELHSYEHKPEELPNREYIWGPPPGKQAVAEIMTPEPVYELESGIQGLRPPPSPGRGLAI